MRNHIPYGKQNITEEDVVDLTPHFRMIILLKVPKFLSLKKLLPITSVGESAVAVANGTAALHLCALALDVEEGQKVITSPITFAASSNCIRYCGGDVQFADIDPKTYLIDIEKVKTLLESSPKGTYNRRSNRLCRQTCRSRIISSIGR